MRPAEIVLLLCLLHSTLSAAQPKDSSTPKLPVFAGLGFNLAEASPLNNALDAGFKQNIFKSTYNKNRGTKDRHYLIPDIAISKSASSCSFSAKSATFRGTVSYQHALQKIAEYNSKLGSFGRFAFSLSSQFDKL